MFSKAFWSGAGLIVLYDSRLSLFIIGCCGTVMEPDSCEELIFVKWHIAAVIVAGKAGYYKWRRLSALFISLTNRMIYRIDVVYSDGIGWYWNAVYMGMEFDLPTAPIAFLILLHPHSLFKHHGSACHFI
ncbi:MAG: hypothetical protein HOP37_09440 [Cyclobacteriaceae bacterium]|nr:hypothetical protein [Cyclobacteriaceae bacterium]